MILEEPLLHACLSSSPHGGDENLWHAFWGWPSMVMQVLLVGVCAGLAVNQFVTALNAVDPSQFKWTVEVFRRIVLVQGREFSDA